ncbi:uncharacterized protein ColSpa_12038 [Colletotrichum spaethianum]|uniref:Uncharacterized protein n=1 Tax=Colletotrichum spaethianum TaxID=700344 RepID=A0AA37US30_9PEZI|nr:uncharacterized protein ColSpa_12038 [Colletotrichum spaethianum]GKT51857.1 hypothetical protein ColSpa_12038 [Colletotrichum spaethianum]
MATTVSAGSQGTAEVAVIVTVVVVALRADVVVVSAFPAAAIESSLARVDKYRVVTPATPNKRGGLQIHVTAAADDAAQNILAWLRLLHAAKQLLRVPHLKGAHNERAGSTQPVIHVLALKLGGHPPARRPLRPLQQGGRP